MRLAAIDIGSNAARLLIQDITIYKDGSLDFTKVNLVRVPLRLGFDVFERGFISEAKTRMLIETMKAFKHLLLVYEVKEIKVCATSAMRDALNSAEIVKQVEELTGLRIEVISGSQEAQILFDTHLADNLDHRFSYLYIDVGGGSTELTLFANNQIKAKQSFNLGTIRLLKDKVEEEIWEDLKVFIKNNFKQDKPVAAIGSGGNINKIFSMSKKRVGKALPIELLREYYKEMNAISVVERMHKYGFREDRADVIVPALQIYTSVMKWANIAEIYVPQIGLADGLIKQLYQELSFTSLIGLQRK
ncbi:MAG: exopolyphosphatase [Chitinophagaceae bacterium]|nr:exopolyphosphatase [Chitinophagaceae bacterium]